MSYSLILKKPECVQKSRAGKLIALKQPEPDVGRLLSTSHISFSSLVCNVFFSLCCAQHLSPFLQYSQQG